MRVHRPEQGVRFVKANGLRFGLLEEGEGPLVLLLHGFPDTAHTWDRTRRVLAEAGFRAVSPFMRGYAPTALPPRDPDARTLGQDVVALIDALGAPAHVVGHDWGASAAYGAANLGPDRIRRLVTVGIPYPPAVRPSLKLAWSVRHFVTNRLPGAARRFARDDFAQVDRLVRRWSPTWDFAPDELEATKNAFAAPGCLDAALGYYRAIGLPPRDMRGDITVPTLAVFGRDDPAVDLATYEGCRRKFTGPYRIEAIGGGHFCHREDPEPFHAALLDFLPSEA